MTTPNGVPVPPEASGRDPPFFLFFLDLLPRWEKGFPSGPWPPWRRRGESPSEIGSVSLSLSVSVFPDSALSPFLKFLEIYNSDWAEILTRFLSVYYISCGRRRAPTALRGGHEGQGRAPYLVGPSSIVSRGFFFPKIIYIRKKSPPVFIPFGLRLIWIFCETKNMQQTGTGTGHRINMLVPKIV